MSLLSYEFRSFLPGLALSILDYKPNNTSPCARREEQEEDPLAALTIAKREIDLSLSRFDIKRLESYSNNIVDYHVVVDLLPTIARFYFLDKFARKPPPPGGPEADDNPNENGVSLSYIQAAILLGLGLQHKTVEQLVDELTLQSNQVLAMFNKAAKKIAKYLKELEEWEIAKELPTKADVADKTAGMLPLETALDEELDERGKKSLSSLQERQTKELFSALSDE